MNKYIFHENNNGKITILHSAIIELLEGKGFMNLAVNKTKWVLVRMEDNLISESSVAEATGVVRDYIKSLNKPEVYEAFARGMGSYVSPSKLNLLKSIDIVDDRDGMDSSVFYFKNGHAVIKREGIEFRPNSELEKPIWRNRVIGFDYEAITGPEKGQFERFCSIIAKKDKGRLRALKSLIGYCLHRNKLRGETKAIILYDENMGLDGKAHGGTGKTLLTQGISKCREVVAFDGRNIKSESWFKNQRIELTTDVMVYDDLARNIGLEGFYSILTTGVEVEKKGKQSFFIDFNESPKVMITSNYPVKGRNDSSDRRRRYEFEVANYFSDAHTPEDEFGNRFFGPHWSKNEWNLFYRFMMECVREYLIYGMVKAKPINLHLHKRAGTSNLKFARYFEDNALYNQWMDKSEFRERFQQEYPEFKETSTHQVTKWIDSIAEIENVESKHKSSNGKNLFILRKPENGKEDYGK